MKWLIVFVLFLSLSLQSFAKDAGPDQWSLILQTLNDSDTSLTNLENSIENYKMLITDLSQKAENMLTTIELQQKQLTTASEISIAEQIQWQTKLADYEKTIENLRKSYSQLAELTQKQKNETDFLRLQITKRNTVIIILSSILTLIFAGFICWVIIKIKAGAGTELIKRLLPVAVSH